MSRWKGDGDGVLSCDELRRAGMWGRSAGLVRDPHHFIVGGEHEIECWWCCGCGFGWLWVLEVRKAGCQPLCPACPAQVHVNAHRA